MRDYLLFQGTWLRVSLLLLMVHSFFASHLLAATATIEWTDVHQRIDGFGVSSAFNQAKIDDLNGHLQSAIDVPANQVPLADFIFDQQKGLGFSLLRSRISSDSPANLADTTEWQAMAKAITYGVRVWSTPWSPPPALKNTGLLPNGGYLLRSKYQEYAERLAKYVRDLHGRGINLYALSIQNEPDFNANYESCIWSAKDFHDFLPFLHSALQANRNGDPTMPISKIMLPENGHWQFEMANTTMNDPVTMDMVGILGGHNYGPDPIGEAVPVVTNGKALWQTEACTLFTVDDSYENGMEWAHRVHVFMVNAEVNAFHYWWISGRTGISLGLLTNWVPNPRTYTIGQFSRFIRPGYYRIGATNMGSQALISAYKDPESNKFSVVAVNTTSSAISQNFSFVNSPALSGVTPWMTTSAMNMKQQAVVLMGAENSFTYTLPAMSVVTFVGNGLVNSNAAPTVSLGSAVTINSLLVNPTNIVRNFTGEIADDGLPLGGSVTKAWTKMSGPAVTFTTPKALDTDVTFSTAGDYILRLTANDGVLSSYADLSVKVVGKSTKADPTVSAGANFTAVAGEEVVLNGVITDPDLPAGSTVVTQWIQVSGPGNAIDRRLFIFSPKSVGSRVRFQMEGTYVLRLTYERPAIVGQGAMSISDDVEVNVTLNPPGSKLPPFVYPGNLVATIIQPINQLPLNGVIIYDGTATPNWSKVSGPGTVSFTTPNELKTVATFSAIGTYVLRLTAADGALSGFAERTISLMSPTRKLNVFAGADQTVEITSPAVLNSAITEVGLPTGATVNAKWSKISGSGAVNFAQANFQSTNADTTATFATPGEYVLRLTVSDGTFTIYDETTVKVTGTVPPTNTAPTVMTAAKATPNPILATTTVLSVLGADDGGEGNLKYAWTTSGTPPAPVIFSANNSNPAKSTTASFTKPGAYTFIVTITDAGGKSVTSTVNVTVTRALTALIVSPPSASVVISGTQTFSASGVDQFGVAISVIPTWSVSGGGTISSTTGVFTAGLTIGGPFTVTATDGSVSDTSTVTVMNAAPSVAMAAKATPNPVLGRSTTVSVLGADDGGEGNLKYAWTTSGTPPAPVTFLANNSNPAKSTTATFTKPGAYTFIVTITDAGGKSVTSTVNVTVTRAVDVLTVSPASASVVVGGTQTFTASGVDQFGVAISVNPTWSVSGGGTISSTTGVFTAGPTSGGPFTVTATDRSASDTSAVTVKPAPKIAPTVATAAKATPNPVLGTTTTLSVLGADDGGEANLKYHWDTTGTPPAAVTFVANDTNSAKSTSATFTQAGTYALAVTITDLDSKTVTSTVSVSVNQKITATITPATATILAGATRKFTAQAIDQFGDPILPASTWTWTVAGGGSISAAGLFTAGSVAGGPYTITATSGTVSATAKVTITAIVDTTPPTTPGAPTVTGNNTVAPTVGGTTEANATIDVLVDGVPAFTTTADASGVWNVKLTGLASGAHQIAVTATDSAGNTSGVSPSATATVTLPNQRPVATAQSVTLAEDTVANITLAGTDSDGTITTYTYQQPANGTVSGSGASVTYTPNANYFGDDSFTFTVTDNKNSTSVPVTVSMTITPVNDAPTVLKAIGPKFATVGVLYNFTFLATTFSDIDADPLTYTASGLPPGLVFVPANRRISGTPTTDGTSTVVITASDGNGGMVDASFDLTVTSVPDTTAPPTPGAPIVTGDNTTAPTISGSTEPNATITIRVDGVVVATTTADSSGNWTYTFTNPPAGSHQIAVVATDASGNTSVVSPAVTVTIPGGSPGGGGGGASAGGGGGGCGLGSGSAGLMTLFAWFALWLRLLRHGFQPGS